MFKRIASTTVMSYGEEVIEKKRPSNNEVASFLGRYAIDKVAMESSMPWSHAK
jgi:hypothetical protein